MSIFKTHVPALGRLEERIERQEFVLKRAYEEGQRVLYLIEELEQFIIKNFGKEKGEEYVEKFLKSDLAFINSRISMNEFEAAEDRINKIMKQTEEIAVSNSGVAFAGK